MGGDDHDAFHAVVLPHLHELVHDAVERLSSKSRTACVRPSTYGDPVRQGGRPEDARPGGDRPGDMPSDDDVAAHREMRPVLLQGPDGEDQSWVGVEESTDLGPRQLVDGT